MKIISLDGENLASLAAPFHIDFAQGVLADAGLFAICGNTGSGKSTLLDAICLSLFDAMPRFSANRRGPSIGHVDTQENERLKSNDVRHILTRGAASGFAQVVFQLDNGQQYSARWSVKRARGSASGRFQAQEMQLFDCQKEQVIASKKTEVLAIIESLIGLNYEQFKRSVLLAQGDFAAFLKAPAKDRSDLLERITGTQLYSQLSKMAFTTAKEQEHKLQLLQSKQGDVSLLSQEQQQQLAQNIGGVNEALAKISQQQQQVQWLDQQLAQQTSLAQQMSDGQQEIEQAQNNIKQQEENNQLVQKVELAQGANVVKVQLAQREEEQVSLVEQQSAQQKSIVVQEQTYVTTQHQVEQLKHSKTQAQTHFELQLPELELAIRRSVEVAQLAEQLLEKQQQISVIEQQQSALQRKLQGNESLIEQNSHVTHQLNGYVAQHQHLSLVVNQLGTIEQAMSDYLQLQQNNQQYQEQVAQDEQAQQQLSSQLIDANKELEQQHKQVQDLTQQLQTYVESFSGTSLSQMESQIEALQYNHGELSKQQQLVIQALQYQHMIGQKQQQEQEIQQHLNQSRITYQNVKQQLQSHLPAAEEANRSLLQAQKVMSLTEHRQGLVAEEACALCGSKDHPYAKELNVGDQLIAQLIERDGQLSQRSQALNTELTQLDVIGKQQAQHLTQIIDEIAELNGLLNDMSLGDVSKAMLASVDEQLAQTKLEIEQAKTQYQQVSQLVEQARVLEQKMTNEQHQVEIGKQHIDNLQHKTRSLDGDLLLAKQYSKQFLTQMEERIGFLQDLYGTANWPEILNDAARRDDFKRQMANDVEQFIEKSNYLNQLNSEALELNQNNIALTQQIQHLTQQLQPLKQQYDANQTQHGQWQAQLTDLTDGQDPVHYKKALEEQLKQLSQACNNAELALMNSHNEILVQQNNLQQISQHLVALNGEVLTLQDDWVAWQRKLGINADELNELLNYDHQWLLKQRQQQAALLQHYHQVQAVFKEQQQRLDEGIVALNAKNELLLQLCPELSPKPSLSDCGQREMLLKSIAAQHKQCSEEQFNYRSALEQHNQSMIRHGQLQQEIEQQSVTTQLWLEMKDLIGSADGAKFRTFAQSLTLEQMLVSANHHLKELAPRYLLQRVPGAELDLQMIDQDMGDEVRSIDSLSGGETFLVSLALALGLGSISNLQTKINTLFIDEGFGTLDPDTLEVALSCLDSLQASGRQIGIISHVQGLVERVGTRIQITALGNGQSKIELLAR